jgi:hypothetical protein
MAQLILSVIAIGAVVLFVWFMAGKKSAAEDVEIDPTDSRQIGMLIGMMGGDARDAAVARFALVQFEAQYGRKATVRDMAIVAGMMRSGR